MLSRILHQGLYLHRIWTVLPFAHNTTPNHSLHKYASSSLITMDNADLRGIVVDPPNQSNSISFEFCLQELKQEKSCFQAAIWCSHDSRWLTDQSIQSLNLLTSKVAVMKFGGWEKALFAAAVESECLFQMSLSRVGGAAVIVTNGNFLSSFGKVNCMDGLPL
jgi:hypothetical protein